MILGADHLAYANSVTVTDLPSGTISDGRVSEVGHCPASSIHVCCRRRPFGTDNIALREAP
jgi:hypothetical protein